MRSKEEKRHLKTSEANKQPKRAARSISSDKVVDSAKRQMVRKEQSIKNFQDRSTAFKARRSDCFAQTPKNQKTCELCKIMKMTTVKMRQLKCCWR